VGTQIPLPRDIYYGLSLGLNFIPMPKKHLTLFETMASTYSKFGKEIIQDAVDWLSQCVHTSPATKYNSPGQRQYRDMKFNIHYKSIFNDHQLTLTDKKMGSAICHKDWLSQAADKLLSDTTAYKRYPDNAGVVVNRIVIPWNEMMDKNFKQNEVLYEHISGDLEYKIPHIANFYALPKPLKFDVSPLAARPITGAFNSLTTRASKVLNDILRKLQMMLTRELTKYGLKHLYKVVEHSIESISHMNDYSRRINHENADVDIHWETYDFVSMYTNMSYVFIENMVEFLLVEILKIPESYSMKVMLTERSPVIWDSITSKWIHDFAPSKYVYVNNEEILSLITAVMTFSWVYCKDKPGYLWKQTRGMAMGTNAAPPLANLSLAVLEIFIGMGYDPYSNWLEWVFPHPDSINPEFVVDTLPLTPQLIARYIDDLLVANPGGKDSTHVETYLKDLYYLSDLKFTPGAHDDTSVFFLDIQIVTPTPAHALPQIGMYSKPNSAHEYHPWDSYTPRATHSGIIIGGFKRIQNLNPDPEDRLHRMIIFIQKLTSRGYPLHKIVQIIHDHMNHPKLIDPDYHIVLDFHEAIKPSYTMQILYQLQRHKNIRVVYRTHPNLFVKSKYFQDDYHPFYIKALQQIHDL
jgi:hypothetical protein